MDIANALDALSCCSASEMPRLALEDDKSSILCSVPLPDKLRGIKRGDRLKIGDQYTVGNPDGWLRVIRISFAAINGPHILAVHETTGRGGFIGMDSIEGFESVEPTSRSASTPVVIEHADISNSEIEAIAG